MSIQDPSGINLEWNIKQLQGLLAENYQANLDDKQTQFTLASSCLGPLLKALNWKGELRYILEAMPHFDPVNSINDLRSILVRLDYNTQPQKCSLATLRKRDMPCLYVTEDNEIYAILSKDDDDKIVIFNSKNQKYEHVKPMLSPGTAYIIKPIDFESAESEQSRRGWISTLLDKFKRTFLSLFVVTLTINLLSLAIPIYVITIYDKVIGTKSIIALIYISMGMALVVVLESLLRLKRVEIISYLGARIEALLLIKSFQHLLKLPISVVNSAPIGAQITRLKQFESIRDIFTGNLAEAFLDVPFLIFFLMMSFIIGGYLGWIPVALMVFYFLLGFITFPLVKLQVAHSGEGKSKNRNFLTELVTKHRSISYNAGAQTWTNRYGKLWSDFTKSNFIAQNTNFILQTITQSMMLFAGITTLGLGVIQVMQGNLSNGALIALMIIIWRMLSPIQTVFVGLHRLSLVTESFKQVDYLAKFKTEQSSKKAIPFYRKFKGNISINNVAFRFAQDADPVLRKISFDVGAGEIIAITGPSGAGKSTLLKILLGLYQTQLGNIMMDGLDIRQINVNELRNRIGYVPQETTCFYGTVAQNMSLSQPDANLKDIEGILDEIGLLEKLNLLPDKLNTRIKASEKYLFSDGMLQQLCLARAFIKRANIYYLDDPSKNMDQTGNAALINKILTLREKATVLMVTHDKDFLRIADRVVIFSSGVNIADVPPSELIKEDVETQQMHQNSPMIYNK
ncbi:MAG: ATP-binding cassette domain-containing protein [Pseudomonadota bacterium]